MDICFYATEDSISVLTDASQKLFLVGSDGGYGNFGDILQLKNSVRLARLSGRFSIVIVMVAGAISDADFPAWVNESYGADAVIFSSTVRLAFNDGPALGPVRTVRNLACIHLYGGGFLNSFWGDYQLSVAEALLRSAPEAAYVISGQQITPPFHERVARHVRLFRPRLLGVRDELSLSSLCDEGVNASFSFDDATEALQLLTRCLPLERGPGFLLHLNSSDYTGASHALPNFGKELALLAERRDAQSGVTLLQAFRDTRHEVLDSHETLKMLDRRFPFADTRLVDLAEFALKLRRLPTPLTGDLGYSCSYHVALWLQLAGIPCWLRHGNGFYDQKAAALQVAQDLEDFLREPILADHSANLERRSAWLELYANTLRDIPGVNTLGEFADDDAPTAQVALQFKGMPTPVQKIGALQDQIVEQQLELDRSTRIKHELHARVQGLTARLTEVGSAYRVLLDSFEERLAAADERARVAQDEAADRAALLFAVHSSMSWKVTRPLRAVSRYVRRGHFDEKGEVGLFRLAQLLGRRLPLPRTIRQRIGRVLAALRR